MENFDKKIAFFRRALPLKISNIGVFKNGRKLREWSAKNGHATAIECVLKFQELRQIFECKRTLCLTDRVKDVIFDMKRAITYGQFEFWRPRGLGYRSSVDFIWNISLSMYVEIIMKSQLRKKNFRQNRQNFDLVFIVFNCLSNKFSEKNVSVKNLYFNQIKNK